MRIKIPNPSPNLIVPQKDSDITINNFNLPLTGDSSEIPEPSDANSHLSSRWAEAFMRLAKEDPFDDESPRTLKERPSKTPESAVQVSVPVDGSGLSKGTKRRRTEKASALVPEGDRWTPPLPDESVQVPGELVLAKEAPSNTFFWPAKVTGYVPPASRKAPPKYEVTWLDRKVDDITRDLFYIYEQDEFGTCKVYCRSLLGGQNADDATARRI